MKNLKKLTALLLSLILIAASLASCGGKDGLDLSDPAGLLKSATEATAADLKERYSGSPLAAMGKVLSGDTYTADLSLGDDSTEVKGTLLVDNAAQQVQLDGNVNSSGVGIDMGFYYSTEFMGVSMPVLTGDTYYGLRPSGLTEQLQGSALAELLELDMESFAELDAVLESLSANTGNFGDTVEKLQSLAQDAYSSSNLTAEAATIDVGGNQVDGAVITGSMEGAALADYYEKVFELLDGGVLDGMNDLAGSDSEDEITADFNKFLDSIRNGNGTQKMSYEVADGKFIRSSAELTVDGDTYKFDTELYDDFTVTITEGGDTVTLKSHVESTDTGYTHTLNVSGAATNMDITAKCGSDGALDLSITADGDTLTLTGTFASSDTSADITGKLTADGESLDVTVSLKNSATITAPENRKNLGEMSEEELYALILPLIIMTQQ